MLTVYLDDSGTSPTDSVAVVAGYLSSVDMWNKFISRWETLLKKYEIKILHRVDLEAFQREFKDWNGKRRTEFLKKVHAIIREHTYTAVGLALIKSDYEEVISKHKILSNFGIFSWCSEGCLAGIRTWCDQHNWNEPIHYVFEAGTEGSGQFSQILQSLYKNEKTRTGNRIGGWSFENKSLQPLQAADVVAYEFFRFIRNEVVDKRKRKIRLSMQDLFRPPQDASLLKHFDKRAFENMVIRTDSGAMPE